MKGITCPNHKEELEGLPFPLPSKGVGKCPVSGVDFEFEAQPTSERIAYDVFGGVKKVYDYKITGND